MLLICLGTAEAVDGVGVLWFISLMSLFVSVVATVLFLLDKSEPVLYTITGGTISWNVVVRLSLLSAILIFRNSSTP